MLVEFEEILKKMRVLEKFFQGFPIIPPEFFPKYLEDLQNIFPIFAFFQKILQISTEISCKFPAVCLQFPSAFSKNSL